MPYDSEMAQQALDGYSETLRRAVAATLLKPRNPIPLEELSERILTALANPPVVDRRIRDLPPDARATLAILGLSRRFEWKLGHLLTVLAALGHTNGFEPIQVLLGTGLLYPRRDVVLEPLESFDTWLGFAGVLESKVFALSNVALRAKDEPLELPDLSSEADDPNSVRLADGLEWPLRIAAAVQLVHEAPVRRTIVGALFKRDATRLQASDLLNSNPSDALASIPEGGVLALSWAEEWGRLIVDGDQLVLPPHSEREPVFLGDTLAELTAALFGLQNWDPLRGFHLSDPGLSPFPSATLLSLLLLARAGDWVAPASIAEWLWANHPSWQAVLDSAAQKDRGAAWVENLLLGVFFPLRVVEALPGKAPHARLSELGRHLFAGGPKPAEAPLFPQTLLVQPNAEILAYRQGLTPLLIEELTRFARWKSFGAACTLELTPEQTYRGLETGLSLAGIVQTLNRHGSRPVPAPVSDLLQRWANKRERLAVYPSATLVEFQTPADLDSAISRGIVAVRVTDRIGLGATGGDPDFKHLRLIGNRDYDTRPARCLNVAEDGLTLTVDAGAADLLLEAEIGKIAELVPGDYSGSGGRKFAFTPHSLALAAKGGWGEAELESWFLARTGQTLSPAARLLFTPSAIGRISAESRMILTVATSAIADGLYQWPRTQELLEERLGPVHFAISRDDLPQLKLVLAEIGVPFEAA